MGKKGPMGTQGPVSQARDNLRAKRNAAADAEEAYGRGDASQEEVDAARDRAAMAKAQVKAMKRHYP